MEENNKPTQDSAHPHSAQSLNMPPQKSGGSKAWMIISIILLIALIGLGIYGYTQMKKLNQEITSQKAEIATLSNKNQELETSLTAAEEKANKTTTATNTQTDDQQIVASTKNFALASNVNVKSAEVNIVLKDGEFARASVTPSPSQQGYGGSHILKKKNGSWIVVWNGNGSPTQEEAQRLGLPNNGKW